MLTFKLIRKIGKILRGGAGRKEIMLGTLCGVFIGFNPSFSFTLTLAILLTLLLNANISFTVLGVAAGKLLSFILAPLSFHTGFFIIHNLGMEDLFRSLCNAPITALMKLNVYAMIGSLPYALVIGLALGALLGTAVIRIRKKMLEADQHEIIGKTFGNKFSRLLLRLAFGKSKLSLDEEVVTKAPWMRKSGLILVVSVAVIGVVFEFFLLDVIVRKGLETSISSSTGAEVNIAEAHLSMAKGELSIHGLEVTDPDKPTHNLIQIDTLAADINVSELLSRNYAIDLLACSTLKRDVLRSSPGAVYEETKEPEEVEPAKNEPGKSLEDYFAKARDWEKYGKKAYDYLKTHKENAKSEMAEEKPAASKATALVSAEKLGYLKAFADLAADHPAWLIHKIRVEQVNLGNGFPEQVFIASEVSSHPELNRKPTSFAMFPIGSSDASLKVVLRFDDPSALHAVDINLQGIPIGDAVETSDSFPVDIHDGTADIRASGRFSADDLAIPFTLLIHELKANVEDGEQVMGMDADTASEVFSSMEQLEINGALGGSLLLPRVSIDYEKLTANMKNALVSAGKKELSKRANAEMDKAKDELKKQAGEEVNKLLGGDEGESTGDKAKNALKKLF